MGELVLDYSEIMDAKKAAEKTAKRCEDYVEEIGRRVTKKISDVKLGESTYTTQANVYASQKIQELQQKRDRYNTYASALYNFVNDSDGAKQVDKAASDALSKSYSAYIDSHNIKVNPIVASLTALSVWAGNEKTGIIKTTSIGKILAYGYDFVEGCKNCGENIEYWYRCEGGKNVLKVICTTVVAVGAVVVAVVAWPAVVASFTALTAAFSLGALWTFTVATAAFVGGVISAANSLTDMVYEWRAWGKFSNNQVAEGKMDSNINSWSDHLRSNIYDNKWQNRLSMTAANAWDTTETVCNVVSFVDLAKNGVKFMQENNTIFEGWKKIKSTTASAKSKLTSVKEGGLRTLKTDLLNKTKEGLHKLTTKEGVVDFVKRAWNGLKSIGEKVDSINDATENLTIKNYSETTDWIAGLNKSAWYKNGLTNIVNFGQSDGYKAIKTTKKIAGYGVTLMDKGISGVVKKGIKEIDIIGGAWDVGEVVTDKIKEIAD